MAPEPPPSPEDTLEARSAEAGLSSEIVQASIGAYGATSGGIRTAHTDSWVRAGDGPVGVVGREEREARQDRDMAPGATRARGAGNREWEEQADPTRTCFEKDRDRIRYARPFRRLAGKCQVFLAPDDIHVRTRMTHTLEVAQVAGAIAQAVGLNVALAEAIALGHDCGHGPGGHASEDALAPYVEGGYDHALYGADVALSEFNLCRETLDGIRQHSWRLSAPATPEGEVVSIADRLAYVVADRDDAVRTGILGPTELPALVAERLGATSSQQTHTLMYGVVDAVVASGRIGITEWVAEALDAYRDFNYERIYLRDSAAEQNRRVVDMLRWLVEHLAEQPGLIPAVANGEWETPMSRDGLAVAHSVRYVSGMTDNFAIASARRMGYDPQRLPRGL